MNVLLHRLAHLLGLNRAQFEHYEVDDYDGRHLFIAPKCVTCGHINRWRADHSLACPCLQATLKRSAEHG